METIEFPMGRTSEATTQSFYDHPLHTCPEGPDLGEQLCARGNKTQPCPEKPTAQQGAL